MAARGYFFFRSMARGAPAVMSSLAAAQAMMELGGVKPGMRVLDLGSGSGTLLLMAAQRGARAVGVELDPFKVLESRLRAKVSPWSERVEVRWGDLWETEPGEADVVFIYLTAGRMGRLKERLGGRMKPGALLVSNRFQLPGCVPESVDARAGVYAYRAPFEPSA